MYQLAANTEAAIYSADQLTAPTVCSKYFGKLDTTDRIAVYTDGSCALAKIETLAHAGWGVTFGAKACSFNTCGRLVSTIQTSYRAELRAIAHVLAVSKSCMLVLCDCKSIVNTLKAFQNDGIRRDNSPALEIWEFIYNMVECMPDQQIVSQWIPSHLEDPKRAGERKK